MPKPGQGLRRGHAGGVNMTLAYKRNGKLQAYRVRCIGLSHGYEQIAEESEARTFRAFYPHEVAPSRFTITVALLGRKRTLGDGIKDPKTGKLLPLSAEHTEYERFNVWMTNYMHYMLKQDEFAAQTAFPLMAVACPVRQFYRFGIPLGPIQFGEQVGSMVWNQTVTFETTHEPADLVKGVPKEAKASSFLPPKKSDSNNKYFYPSGKQLGGFELPDVVTGILERPEPPSTDDVQDAVTAPYVPPVVDGEPPSAKVNVVPTPTSVNPTVTTRGGPQR